MTAPLNPEDTTPAFRFCPRCGGPLARRFLKSTEPEGPVCARCGFIFYLDPKIAVGTIIKVAGDRIVLVRRAIEPGYGRWVFPGGYVDRGEPLTVAAIREPAKSAGSRAALEGSVKFSHTWAAPRSSSSTRPRRLAACCLAMTRCSKRRRSRARRFHGT